MEKCIEEAEVEVEGNTSLLQIIGSNEEVKQNEGRKEDNQLGFMLQLGVVIGTVIVKA